MSEFPRRFGRYELVGHLSNGGMAQVYLARMHGQSATATKVIAIKTVLPSLSDDQSFVKLFEREIGLAMSMNHPNIVAIYDFGVVDKEYYMAMEFVHGKNLQAVGAKLLEAGVVAPIGFSCFAVAQVCRALAYAHGYCDPVTKKHAGIVHRDISPHNILVSYTGQVKLFDFGVAKIGAREGVTESGVVKGKPAYLAPEQARGEELDDRVDIFALGIVLWEMLTGKRLFFDVQPLMAIKKVTDMEIPPPSKLNPAVPGHLDRIVLKALERDLLKRYQLCKELGADLERALISDGVSYGEKQARELMGTAFKAEIAEELQSMQLKFNGRPAAAPAEPGSPPPLPSAGSVDDSSGGFRIAPTAPAPQPAPYVPPSGRGVSVANIVAALLLVALGAWVSTLMRPTEFVPTPQAAQVSRPAPVAAPAPAAVPAAPVAAAVAPAPVAVPVTAPAETAHRTEAKTAAAVSLKEMEEAQLRLLHERLVSNKEARREIASAPPVKEAAPAAAPAPVAAPAPAPAPAPRREIASGEANCDASVPYNPRCTGDGFIGCLAPDSLARTGAQNQSGSALEYYCDQGQTRICLSFERCPWRPGADDAASHPEGLTSTPAAPREMTCSPYGLATTAGGPPAPFATCRPGANCGFSMLVCDGNGRLNVVK